jgi:hypothetical protein
MLFGIVLLSATEVKLALISKSVTHLIQPFLWVEVAIALVNFCL